MFSAKDRFVQGHWLKSSGAPLQSYNPATQETVWSGNAASKKEIDEAFMAAKEAANDWAFRPFEERVIFIKNFGKEIQLAQQTVAEAISKEVGKPYWESLSEVEAMLHKINYSIDAYEKRSAPFAAKHPTAHAIARPKPHGVVAVFGPFNFPGHLPNGHIVPALLAGNTLLFKPSELTPLVAQLLVSCWEKASLPAGVLNLLQGGKECGAYIASHSSLDGLFFTGSYETGRKLLEQFSHTPQKILALEMGGNNPLVVSHIHNVEAAALVTIQSAYLTSGQRCTCARRLIVIENEQTSSFLEKLQSLVLRLRIGPYTQRPEPYIGPLVSLEAANTLRQAQTNLVEQGGKLLLKMEGEGAFLSPGLIDVTTILKKNDREYFGPLLQLIRVQDMTQAIQEANQTQYGLSAGLLSNNEDDYQRFYREIKAGIINWNCPLTGASSALPFGGIKNSGNHRPSAYYAADYCSYPVASLEVPHLQQPSAYPLGFEN